MKQHQRSIGKNDEWLTPPEIIAALELFDLDPCSPVKRPWATARAHYTKKDDGLNCAWFGRVWLNPPFNRYERAKWMEKMAAYGNGIMLVPAATETEAFCAHVWEKADAICFLKGRPHFHYVDGTRAAFNCGTAIALVAYGWPSAVTLFNANLGRTLRLK